jgi:hypothetical protein
MSHKHDILQLYVFSCLAAAWYDRAIGLMFYWGNFRLESHLRIGAFHGFWCEYSLESGFLGDLVIDYYTVSTWDLLERVFYFGRSFELHNNKIQKCGNIACLGV